MIVVAGAAGTGKSTEVFKTFQNSLAILSSANNYHYPAKLFRTKLKDEVLPGTTIPRYRPPKKVKLIDVSMMGTTKEDYTWLKPSDSRTQLGRVAKDVDGSLILIPDENGDRTIPVNQKAALENTISAVVAKSQQAINKGEKPPYDNLIIDEWGEFMDRVHAEIVPTAISKNGAPNPMAAYGMTAEWVSTIINQMKQLSVCGVGVCLVMHDREPEEGKKGGPKSPSSGISNKICTLVDGVIQRYMKDPAPGERDEKGNVPKSKRLWSATASEKWNRKLRGLEPEDEERIATMELYDILDLCGFDMGGLGT